MNVGDVVCKMVNLQVNLIMDSIEVKIQICFICAINLLCIHWNRSKIDGLAKWAIFIKMFGVICLKSVFLVASKEAKHSNVKCELIKCWACVVVVIFVVFSVFSALRMSLDMCPSVGQRFIHSYLYCVFARCAKNRGNDFDVFYFDCLPSNGAGWLGNSLNWWPDLIVKWTDPWGGLFHTGRIAIDVGDDTCRIVVIHLDDHLAGAGCRTVQQFGPCQIQGRLIRCNTFRFHCHFIIHVPRKKKSGRDSMHNNHYSIHFN